MKTPKFATPLKKYTFRVLTDPESLAFSVAVKNAKAAGISVAADVIRPALLRFIKKWGENEN